MTGVLNPKREVDSRNKRETINRIFPGGFSLSSPCPSTTNCAIQSILISNSNGHEQFVWQIFTNSQRLHAYDRHIHNDVQLIRSRKLTHVISSMIRCCAFQTSVFGTAYTSPMDTQTLIRIRFRPSESLVHGWWFNRSINVLASHLWNSRCQSQAVNREGNIELFSLVPCEWLSGRSLQISHRIRQPKRKSRTGQPFDRLSKCQLGQIRLRRLQPSTRTKPNKMHGHDFQAFTHWPISKGNHSWRTAKYSRCEEIASKMYEMIEWTSAYELSQNIWSTLSIQCWWFSGTLMGYAILRHEIRRNCMTDTPILVRNGWVCDTDSECDASPQTLCKAFSKWKQKPNVYEITFTILHTARVQGVNGMRGEFACTWIMWSGTNGRFKADRTKAVSFGWKSTSVFTWMRATFPTVHYAWRAWLFQFPPSQRPSDRPGAFHQRVSAPQSMASFQLKNQSNVSQCVTCPSPINNNTNWLICAPRAIILFCSASIFMRYWLFPW